MIPPTVLPPAPLPATPAAGPAPATVRVDAFQSGTQQQAGNGMGQAFNNAIDGFSTRSQAMQASMRELAATGVGGAGNGMSLARPPAQAASSVAGATPAGGPAGTQSPMALMVDSFNFAIEASLVSRAATQFTGAVGTLMKGQ